MVLKQNQFTYNNTIENINNAKKEQLNPFIEQYLNDHSYFKPRDIALDYLFKKHQITMCDLSSYNSVIKTLIHKISKLLGPYKISGTISLYNAKTYQIIKTL